MRDFTFDQSSPPNPILLPIAIIAIGTASAWLSSAFTFWVFSLYRLLLR
ncbi:MAG: hypothetical protein HC886_13190 [Leptolyngbyaceae cyanobacterium SM1_1_3]|nr:hypothetical protein [Leptolyngbyaceae cyanobacterium SM1_1_3]NJN02985.1 hypothetical protein [Leptolyngbyaceae cyanobacterium RM1_1_2]NJO10741.1 hypothetical protein [Leptolyngbyaceae cyanobacterium SL_1_1]